jgi:hypothetical protein
VGILVGVFDPSREILSNEINDLEILVGAVGLVGAFLGMRSREG